MMTREWYWGNEYQTIEPQVEETRFSREGYAGPFKPPRTGPKGSRTERDQALWFRDACPAVGMSSSLKLQARAAIVN
jgi:hypothetical protein